MLGDDESILQVQRGLMRVAIMQPYFFPYIGYWQLIYNCDEWVFFDSVQYNKKSWMNRNRILHPDPIKEYQYINVPIRKHSKGTLIKDVKINNDEEWVRKLQGQLTLYKKLNAPYYDDVINIVNIILKERYEDFISLVSSIVNNITEYLGLSIECRRTSELGIDESRIKEADDWALIISESLGANEYINPPGGVEIFNEGKYQDSGIDIRFLKSKLSEYRQSKRDFVSGLSILDVMMFNSIEEVCEMIKNDYILLSKSELLT